MPTIPEDPLSFSPTKQALLALKQLQAKLDELERAKTEPIAIIGMGCRFPGEANHPDAFWHLLREGIDAITEVPSDRWELDTYFSPDPNQAGRMYTRHGGFVSNLWDFDAPFFRISPREAMCLDPQQRLLLEVAWEALEQAGIAPDQLLGTATGVFVGICSIDYWQQLLARQPTEIDAYLATGNTHSMAAGRLSYRLGLTGPSLAIDTACSSSLVTVHLACQSLRNRECNLALAGGVNRILTPATSINFSKAKMLSPAGRCKTFDAAADGFVRAEGCGLVVLKRLSDAIAAGDTIQALILGSAVNHDGRTSGLTVPNGPAQQAVIRQALQNSGVEPAQVSYIETHGTATALGDPIEVGAIAEVFNTSHTSAQPLILGSVKTNIGHLEAAAGIAGLIKTVLALRSETIPRNLHFQTPNPHIPWSELPIKVPTTNVAWKQSDTQRVAGISSFGFNGTNAHVIVADQPTGFTEHPASSVSHNQGDRTPSARLFILSARTEVALKALVSCYVEHLSQHSTLDIADICYTASLGRSHFNDRLAIVTTSVSDLSKKLSEFVAGQPIQGLMYGRSQDSSSVTIQITSTLEELAQSYVQGAAIDWSVLYTDRLYRRVVLPTYPFQRQPYRI